MRRHFFRKPSCFLSYGRPSSFSCSFSSNPPVFPSERLETLQFVPKLPLIFLHGLLGFESIGPLVYWKGVKQDMTKFCRN